MLEEGIAYKCEQQKETYRNPSAFQRSEGYPEKEQQNSNKDNHINGEVFNKEKADDKEYVEENFDFREQQVTLMD